MARVNLTRRIGFSRQTLLKGKSGSDADDLRNLVRDGLLSMTAAAREQFVQALETELRRAHLSIRAYLIPLGIPARSPDEMMPSEVAHLIRFLKINVPQAVPAIEKAMARFGITAMKAAASDDYLAA
ncbi:MAG: hypothetical protein WBV94_16565 [Blastocatellia bacterium]